jgi:hypothetical protein
MSFGGDFRAATNYESSLWASMSVLLNKEEDMTEKTTKAVSTEPPIMIDYTPLIDGFEISVNQDNYHRKDFATFRRTITATPIQEIRYADVNNDQIIDIIAVRDSKNSIYTYVLTNDTAAVRFDDAVQAFYLANDQHAK